MVEDVRFFGGRYAIWTSKPSPSWQFTVIDSYFEGQREAAILEREAGLTLIRPHFVRVPTAVAIEPGWADELWVKDARLEEISGPAFLFGVEKNPRNEINMEGVTCRAVPVFAALRDSGKRFTAPGGYLCGEDLFPRAPLCRTSAPCPESRPSLMPRPLQLCRRRCPPILPDLPAVRHLGERARPRRQRRRRHR